MKKRADSTFSASEVYFSISTLFQSISNPDWMSRNRGRFLQQCWEQGTGGHRFEGLPWETNFLEPLEQVW